MASKYIKLPALQGYINGSAQSLLDFDIPDSGLYNLQKSYLSFIVNCDTTETDPADIGIHSVYATPTNVAGTLPFRNNVFIGDKAGQNSYDVDNSIFLGYNAGENIKNGNRIIVLGVERQKKNFKNKIADLMASQLALINVLIM